MIDPICGKLKKCTLFKILWGCICFSKRLAFVPWCIKRPTSKHHKGPYTLHIMAPKTMHYRVHVGKIITKDSAERYLAIGYQYLHKDVSWSHILIIFKGFLISWFKNNQKVRKYSVHILDSLLLTIPNILNLPQHNKDILPVPCQAGKYRSSTMTSCQLCDNDTISLQTGATVCTQCDNGQHANTDKTQCGK